MLAWLSDKYLFKKWLIDTDEDNFDNLRVIHSINKLWEIYKNNKDFSVKIRENRK